MNSLKYRYICYSNLVCIFLFAVLSSNTHAQTGCCQTSTPGCASPVTETQCENITNSVSFHPGGTCRQTTPGRCGVLQPILEDQGDGVNTAIPNTQMVPIQGNPNITDGLNAAEARGLVEQILGDQGFDVNSEPGLQEALDELENQIVNPIDENGVPQPDPNNLVSMAELVDIELVELQLQSIEPILPTPLPVLDVPLQGGEMTQIAFDFRQTFEDQLFQPGIPTFVFTDMFMIEGFTDDPTLPFPPFTNDLIDVRVWTWMFVLKKITVTITETVERVVVVHGDKTIVVEEDIEVEVERWVFQYIHSHPWFVLDDPTPGPGDIPTTGFTSSLSIEARAAATQVPVLPIIGIFVLVMSFIGVSLRLLHKR